MMAGVQRNTRVIDAELSALEGFKVWMLSRRRVIVT